MKFFSNLKRSTKRTIVAGVVLAAVAGVGLGLASGGNVRAEGVNCDSNAVLWCGGTTSTIQNHYKNGDGHNSAASIQHIYSYFGISSSDISTLGTYGQEGYVTSSGNVYAGGHLVATGALTAGREYIAGSTHVVAQGTSFYTRAPHVSFLQSSLTGVVYMKDGVFQFAILHSCGNPVKATPLKPNYTINKEVRVTGTNTFYKSIGVAPGTKVEYRVTVTSTGKVQAKNIVVNDVLPSDTQYVANSLTMNGHAVSSSQFFGAGYTVAALDPGNSAVFLFEAIIGPNTNPATCVNTPLVNNAKMHSAGLPNESSSASVDKQCQPTYACNVLGANTSDDITYKFTVSASTSHGASITGYQFNFGDGQTANSSSNTYSHTYAKSGDYTASANVVVSANGKTIVVSSPNCQVPVKVNIPQPPKPTYACNSLTADQVSRTEYDFTADASASNGATVTGYQFNFGDGSAPLNGASNTANHTYAKPGTYTATVAAMVSVNGGQPQAVTSKACQVKVTVKPAPTAECTGLDVKPGDNFSVSVTANYTQGATLTSASFDFGDGSAPVVGTSNTANHTYAAAGKYMIVASLTFNVEGQSVKSDCKAPVNFKAQPTYTCDNLTVSTGDNRTVTITGFQTSQTNGATFTSAVVNWGDDTNVTTANVTGQTHQYAADGTYSISAVAHFSVDGQDVTASGPNCQKTVTFSTPPVTPPTTPPTTPTSLVNTGPGDVIGLFVGSMIAGILGYRLVLSRRLGRQ